MHQQNQSNEIRSFVSFCALFLSQIILFQLIYIVKRQFFPSSIVFYEGLQICGVTTIVGGVLLLWFVRRKKDQPNLYSNWLSAVFAALLFNYAFIMTIPVVLDRSISILMIGAVAQAGDNGLSPQEINQRFMDVYIDGTHQVDRRILEQKVSGDMMDRDGHIVITPKGMFIARVNLAMARLFNIDPRYVLARK